MNTTAVALFVLTAVCAGMAWAIWRAAAAVERTLADRRAQRSLEILRLFAPGIAAAEDDPRALPVWQRLAAGTRRLFPEEFAALDRAAGTTFPFSAEHLQAAHARWSADWLAWERVHDGEYKLKMAELEQELAGAPGSSLLRARLAEVEREKLDLYQRRYGEYVRVSKALQALTP